MRNLLLCSLAVAALASCGRKEAKSGDASGPGVVASAAGPELGAFGVDLSAMDPSIEAGDDFYRHVNGAWLNAFKIPDDYSSYGSFTMLAERSEERLKTIIDDLSKARAADGSAEQKVRDYYATYLDVASIEGKGLEPIADDLAAINALTSNDAAAALFFNPSFRMKAPIATYIGVDAKRPDRYAVYVTQSGLGMPNRDYYLDEKFADKRTKYRDYIASILRLAGFADPDGAADRIFALEMEFAQAHWDPAKRRNRDLTYNLKTIEQLEAYAPSAPWRGMLAGAGLASLGDVILREDDAVQKTADIIASAPLDMVKEYLKFHLINSNADVLPVGVRRGEFRVLRHGAQRHAEAKRPLEAVGGGRRRRARRSGRQDLCRALFPGVVQGRDDDACRQSARGARSAP